MVGRAESGLSAERAHHDRIALDIQDINVSFPVDPNGSVRNNHGNPEPFAVIDMPEHAGRVIHPEGIVRFHTIFIENEVDQFLSGHASASVSRST